MKVKIVKFETHSEIQKLCNMVFNALKEDEAEFYNEFGKEYVGKISDYENLNADFLRAGVERGFISVYVLMSGEYIIGGLAVNSKEEILFLFSEIKPMREEIYLLLFRNFVLNVLEKNKDDEIFSHVPLSHVEHFIKLGFKKTGKVEKHNNSKHNSIKMTYVISNSN